ncbi:pyridoxal phosphate-dependent aminotransferase [Crossiella sp. NPDC003009]
MTSTDQQLPAPGSTAMLERSALPPFTPGSQTFDLPGVIRLAQNESIHGPSPAAVAAIAAEAGRAHRYPDATAATLAGRVAETYGLRPEQVVVGNGVDELLLFCAVTFLTGDAIGMVTGNTYPGHWSAVDSVGARRLTVPLRGNRIDVPAVAAALRGRPITAFLCNPHNPTGTVLTAEEVAVLVEAAERGGSLLVLDEAYMDFAEPDQARSAAEHVRKGAPVIVLRTFSKLHGLAGLRCGYALASPGLADRLRRVKHVTVYNVNRYALAAAEASLGDTAFADTVRARTRAAMAHFLTAIEDLPWIRAQATVTNFLHCELDWDALLVSQELQQRSVLVRPCADMGFPRHIRVSVGTEEELDQLVAALTEIATELGKP